MFRLFSVYLLMLLIAFCCMQTAQSTNKFLQNLLTTTPSTRHVSDFRMQRKTDSRADKPDTFPGFDLHEDSTIPSPRKRRRQAYSKLIRLFIENTRDRLETIRDVIKDESELHFRLTEPLNAKIDADTDETETNDKIYSLKENDDKKNRQFIDLAYMDTTNSDESSNIANNVTRTYLNSLFAAVGYSRITTTPSSIPEYDMPQDSSIITRYLLNPLFRIWYSTLEPSELSNQHIDSESNVNNANSNNHLNQVNFFDNMDNSSTTESKMQTNVQNVMDNEENESRVDKFNYYSLPLVQLSSNNNETTTITMRSDEDDNMNNVNISQSNVTVHDGSNNKKRWTMIQSTIQEAASAFQNAFYKYSNYMQQSMENSMHKMSDTAMSSVNEKFSEAKMVQSNELSDSGLFVGNIFDGNASNIQVVPSKKHKPHEIDESVNDEIIVGNQTTTTTTTKNFGENAGILIFEIFSTVAGMTWRAFTQIPNYLNGNSNIH